jgi:oligoribonuclease (3'-5' exoribonuclease)
MSKLINQVALKLSEDEKEKISSCLDSIENEKENKKQALIALFEYWRKYIPHLKQQITCGGCQDTVKLFWTKVVNELNK